MNKILVIGNVGSDPEMRYTPSGTAVTSFSLATNRVYTTGDGERHEETEWFRISAWGKLAEQCNNYVTKGMKIYAEGRLKSDTWTGNDGQTRVSLEISADKVLFLDRAPQAGGGEQGGGQPSGGNMGGGQPSGGQQGGNAGGGGPSGGQQGGGSDNLEDLPW
jgi:single-strand DNA-binding protein